ncbi:hypothetical protein K435DRAFT_964109, partial [Dendrothele bispora CBS 962.96]
MTSIARNIITLFFAFAIASLIPILQFQLELIKLPPSIALISGAVAAIVLPASVHILEEHLSHKQLLRLYWSLYFYVIHLYSLYRLLQPLSLVTVLVGTLLDFIFFVQIQRKIGRMTIPQLGIMGMLYEIIQIIAKAVPKIVDAEEEGSPAVTVSCVPRSSPENTDLSPSNSSLPSLRPKHNLPLLPTSMPTTSNPLFISLPPDEVAPPPYDSSSASVVKS